jgi:simple sugar transport system permease protein
MYGSNPAAAAVAGVDPHRFELGVLATSGAICGFAGAIEVLGVYHGYQDATLGGTNSIAWTGLTAAMLVSSGVLALVPVSALLASLVTGLAGVQRDLGIATGLSTLLVGVVVIASALAIRSSKTGTRAAKRPAEPANADVKAESRSVQALGIPVGRGST